LFQRVLTDLERKRIRAYLRTSSRRRPVPIRTLISGAHKYLPAIDMDRELLVKLVKTYQQRDLGVIWEKGRKYPSAKEKPEVLPTKKWRKMDGKWEIVRR
jgi:hypothetical protein